MASTRERFTKDGRRYFEIRCRRGRDKSEVTTRWYPPVGKAESTIKKLLEKAAFDFETAVSRGDILSAHEQKEADIQKAALEAAERAKIQTVEQFSKLFMEKVRLGKSENTRTNYQCLLDRHVLPQIGMLPVQDVTGAEIDGLMTKMLAGGYALTTRQRVWTVLCLLFKQAKKAKLIRYSPMDDIEDERPTATKADKAAREEEKEKFYSADEIKRLLDAMESEPLKWRCFVWLLALSGVRRGEALAIQWTDIDFAKQEIRISKSLNYTAQAGIYTSSTKSGKTRVVCLRSDDPGTKLVYEKFFDMLRDLKESQRQSGKVIRFDGRRGGWVFQQEDSTEPMHPTSPTTYFRRFGEKHSFENFHPHLLRHSFVSIAIAEGQDVVAVSRSAGHADPRITLAVYAHASTESIRQVASAVGKAISDSSAENDHAGAE